MLALLLPIVAHDQTPSGFDFDLRSGSGLSIRMSGVPIVVGSGLQYYEPGWKKGYFSTNNAAQTIEKPDVDTVEMRFAGADGHASGSERVHRDGERLTAHYHLEWSGDHPVEIELTAGLIWAPALRFGSLTADGRPTRDLSGSSYTPDQDTTPRRYAPDGKSFQFQAPVGAVEAGSSLPMTLFDARGYHQDYAEGRSIWWYGALDLPVAKGQPVDLDVVWTLRATPPVAPRTERLKANSLSIPNAQTPDLSVAPLIPKPKFAKLDYGKPTELTNIFSFPAGRPRYWDLFKDMLSRRYIVPPPAKGAAVLNVDGGVSKLGVHPGGYTIDISARSISVLGEEDDGLRNGMYRLAQLAFVKDGRLYFPSGHLADEPQTRWRGVHLFGGPEAREFQRRLWDRVLLPLGMNKAVIECERTAWQSTPLDESTHPMSRADLAGLFDDYRKVGVEPIPLIQSLGHMGWFFAGKRRLELAVNPAEPYTVDPRKPLTKGAIVALWDEAIDLLKPSAVHFGCDEIDMVGMSPHDPELTTNLWRSQMATLGEISKRHGVSMMIWGDEALAPGEAIDATNGDSVEEAKNRRAAIPEGATICDWHYASDPDPAHYYKTLQLWKREELNPIASTWFPRDNIRGFDLAAYLERAGTLQTTWAGYESSERAMIANSEQFVAMVLAADYSWSARQETVDRLGYDPARVFRQLYFGTPSPVAPERGVAFLWGATPTPSQIGVTTILPGDPIEFRSVLRPGRADGPTDLDLDVAGSSPPIRHLAIALDASDTVAEGEPVATVEIKLERGQPISRRLVYGHHVRTEADPRLTPYAERGSAACVVTIELPAAAVVRRISVHSAGTTAGLRLLGLTGW